MQLAAYRNEGGLAALFQGNGRRQAEQDEVAIASTGVPYTIVRPGALRDEPGGQLGFQFAQVFFFQYHLAWVFALFHNAGCTFFNPLVPKNRSPLQ